MKQKILAELKKLEIKSEEKLEEYVDFCLENNNKDNYECVHHILPKSKNLPFVEYTNLKENIWNASYLSYKNHFIAHYLLCCAIRHKSISFSFIAMKNKDTKSGKLKKEDILFLAEEYENLKKEHVEFSKLISKNKVACILNNKTVVVDKDEYYSNKHKYSTASTGKFNVIDILTGEKIRIKRCDYDKSKFTYHTAGTTQVMNIRTCTIERVVKINKNHITMNKAIIINRNGVNGQIQARELIKSDIIISLDAKKYNKENNTKIKTLSIVCFDLKTKENIKILKKIADKEFFRYIKFYKCNKPNIKVINKNTFEEEKILLKDFDYNKHIYLCKKLQNYFIDIAKKEIVFEKNENTVIYNRKNAKKYLNENIETYIKRDSYICPSNNFVSAFNIKTLKHERVQTEEFKIRDELIGYMSNKAKELRKLNEIN